MKRRVYATEIVAKEGLMWNFAGLRPDLTASVFTTRKYVRHSRAIILGWKMRAALRSGLVSETQTPMAEPTNSAH